MTVAKPPTLVSERLNSERIAAEIAAEPPDLQRWMCFSIAGESYAVNILQLREVLPDSRPVPVPGAPPEVLGVLNLRGEIITLLDLRRWLGLPAGAADGPVLVLELAGLSLGLRVDAVGVLLKRLPVELLAAPAVANPRLRSLVSGATALGDGQLTLLDFVALLPPTAQAA
ncbi:MAG: chemotaxis protein CheW [Stagnimonas sp.]|nr:chemotaxis protein CheW [Stagnimonas sp.]